MSRFYFVCAQCIGKIPLFSFNLIEVVSVSSLLAVAHSLGIAMVSSNAFYLHQMFIFCNFSASKLLPNKLIELLW